MVVYKFSLRKKTIGVIGLLTIANSGIQAQSPLLSTRADISILTCSAGEELYTTFGHSAIHVKDDSLRLDIVFNYGTFDFDTPNFYKKFVDGNLDYMLSVNQFERFVRTYRRENRSVVEHRLRLTQAEKQLMWEKLLINYQPENKYYRYDFFYDNCATRIRDIVFDVKGLKESSFDERDGQTFRDALHDCMGRTSWAAQGIDIILGAKTDRAVTTYEKAFLPVYLDSLLAEADLIASSQTIIAKEEIEQTENDEKPSSTWLVFGILLLLTLFVGYKEKKTGVYNRKFSIAIFTLPLLLSLILWYTWIFSYHSVLNDNINVMWASVLYLPQIVLLARNRLFPARVLAWVNLAILAALILLNIVGVQYLPPIVYLMMIVLVLRNLGMITLK